LRRCSQARRSLDTLPVIARVNVFHGVEPGEVSLSLLLLLLLLLSSLMTNNGKHSGKAL
jgi:hypothetical protein